MGTDTQVFDLPQSELIFGWTVHVNGNIRGQVGRCSLSTVEARKVLAAIESKYPKLALVKNTDPKSFTARKNSVFVAFRFEDGTFAGKDWVMPDDAEESERRFFLTTASSEILFECRPRQVDIKVFRSPSDVQEDSDKMRELLQMFKEQPVFIFPIEKRRIWAQESETGKRITALLAKHPEYYDEFRAFVGGVFPDPRTGKF